MSQTEPAGKVILAPSGRRNESSCSVSSVISERAVSPATWWLTIAYAVFVGDGIRTGTLPDLTCVGASLHAASRRLVANTPVAMMNLLGVVRTRIWISIGLGWDRTTPVAHP